MQRTSTLLLGCTAAAFLTLTACNKADTKAFDPDTYYAALKKDVFVDKSGTELDVAAITASLPESVNMNFERSAFDKKSGATVLNQVRFTLAEYPDTGIAADTLSIWGGNDAGISALLSGAKMDSATPVATRIEGVGLSLFGMDNLFDTLLDATNDMAEGMPQTGLEGYDLSVGKMVVTDLSLYPSTLALLPIKDDTNPEDMKIWHWMQKAADYNARFSLTDMAFYDTTFGLTITEGDMRSNMTGKIDYTATKDYDRGDIGYYVTHDMSYNMDMPYGDSSDRALKMGGVYTHNAVRDMRLAKAMDHIARGVMPERTDTDFMSFGVWEGESSTISFNDEVLYSVGTSHVDMSKFHWLIPEIIDMRVEDITYDIPNFISYMENEMNAATAQGGEDLSGLLELSDMMPKIVEVLKAHDFERPSIDFNFTLKADAKSGDFSGGYGFDVENFSKFKTSSEGTLPDFNAIIALIPDNMEDADPEALQTLFADTFKFKSSEMVMTDEGGFEKSFSMAREFAKLAPEDNMQAAGIARMEPAQMREMFAGMILIGAGSAGQAFPPAVDYMQSFSNFIREGGEFSVSVKPSKPMDIAAFQALAVDAQSDPDKVVETLGLAVTHQTPE